MPLATPPRDAESLRRFGALAQHQAAAFRNLVNTDELKTWLIELLASRFGSPAENRNETSPPPRQAACQRWTLSVARKWMTRQGQAESHQPQGEALAQSPAWIQQAISNGAPPQRLSLLHSEREILAGVLDWMRSDDGPSLASDWSRISVDQAIVSEKAWIDAMAKAALKKNLDAADAAGTTLFADSPAPGPDGQTGWRWVQVHSSEALDREGALMRHCVGSYADDVAAERKSIYSLRDPDNKPRLTLETQQGKVAQLKAFSNQPCPPELFPRVADFARAFESLCQTKGWPMNASQEAESAGVFIFPGLGLLIAGTPPPEAFSAQFAFELSEKNAASLATLPLLAALGWTDLLQLAIPHASANLKDRALIKAAKQGQLSAVELLIPHCDSQPNASQPLTFPAPTQALLQAAYHGRAPTLHLLLPSSNPQANDSQALCWAAENGHLEAVKILLPHSNPKADRSRALRWAARKGRREIVELLIPHSDPKADGSGALSSAASNGQLAIAQLLLPHSDPKANSSHALCLAAGNGHLAVVELLLPYSDSNDQSQALRKARENAFLEISQLIQASIDAQAASPPPELNALRSKLSEERQRQFTPPPTGPALSPASSFPAPTPKPINLRL